VDVVVVVGTEEGTRTLNGTEPASRLLTIVLALNGAMLLPSEDGLALDIVGFKVLDIVGLADGLNQHAHLIWELRDKDHGLEMRGDGAFGCCHPSKADKDSVNGEGRISVPGDYDVHRHLEFFVSGGDPGFAVGGFEELPGYGSEHGVDVGVILNGFFEEVQNSCGERWVEAKHYVPQGFIVGVEPGVNLGLVLGGSGGICNRFGLGSSFVGFGYSGYGFVIRGRKLVCDDLPLALGEKVVHHQWLPGLPIHGAAEDGHEQHESGRHLSWF